MQCACGDSECGYYGHCHCGCGSVCSIAIDSRRGRIRGLPTLYIHGHKPRPARAAIRYGTIDGEPVAYIPLTKGRWAIVDRDKLHLVKYGVWWCDGAGYAYHWEGGRAVAMHNVILPPLDGAEPDHRFGNRLDNRISQLRYATYLDNARNAGIRKDNTSCYKGVSKKGAGWQVGIRVRGKRIYLGYFHEEKIIEAAKTYDLAAAKHFGDFARTNFPLGETNG